MVRLAILHLAKLGYAVVESDGPIHAVSVGRGEAKPSRGQRGGKANVEADHNAAGILGD
jgi:hypothetical protein